MKISQLQLLLKLAEESDSRPVNDGLDVPAEIARRDKRLAAIAQANALLLEEDLPAAQQRLARIVADNVERLKRLVDDVVEVAPSYDQSEITAIAAAHIACDMLCLLRNQKLARQG